MYRVFDQPVVTWLLNEQPQQRYFVTLRRRWRPDISVPQWIDAFFVAGHQVDLV